MKKWLVMFVLMGLILSNIYLIYQHALLLRENKKLLLFQRLGEQQENGAKEKTAETLMELLSMEESDKGVFRHLSVRTNGLSLTMEVKDIKNLEKIEHTLSEYLQQKPRIEAVRNENSIRAVLNYGGER